MENNNNITEMEDNLRVGITHGDINGIGYEIIMKIASDTRICELCNPIIYGSPKVLAYYRKTLNVDKLSINTARSHTEINVKSFNIINSVDDNVRVDMSKITEIASKASIDAIESANEAIRKRELDIVVFAPISSCLGDNSEEKTSILSYLTNEFNDRNIIPIAIGENMKVGFINCNSKISDIGKDINEKDIFYKIRLIDNTLKRDFSLEKPKIAVLGYNNSICNSNVLENDINSQIKGAVDYARNKGIMALGPYNSTTIFTNDNYKKFDIILALDVEQGMLPFSIFDNSNGIYYFAGLPFVCTTTIHGTGFDITGKGVADESALRNAIYNGIYIHRNRTKNRELNKNPLPHYDIRGNINESDINVDKIAGVKEEAED